MYIILSAPRSRSYWLSQFIGCEHAPGITFRDADDVVEYLRDKDGFADEYLVVCWRQWLPALIDAYKDIRIVLIRRPPEETIQSLIERGVPDTPNLHSLIHNINREMDELTQYNINYYPVYFNKIDDDIRMIWAICHPNQPFPEKKYKKMKNQKLNNPRTDYVEYVNQNIGNMLMLKLGSMI